MALGSQPLRQIHIGLMRTAGSLLNWILNRGREMKPGRFLNGGPCFQIGLSDRHFPKGNQYSC